MVVMHVTTDADFSSTIRLKRAQAGSNFKARDRASNRLFLVAVSGVSPLCERERGKEGREDRKGRQVRERRRGGKESSKRK